MARAGLKVALENSLCSIVKSDKCIALGYLRDMHYYLNIAKKQTNNEFGVALPEESIPWHKQLGQVHTEAVGNMCRHLVPGSIKQNRRFEFSEQTMKVSMYPAGWTSS